MVVGFPLISKKKLGFETDALPRAKYQYRSNIKVSKSIKIRMNHRRYSRLCEQESGQLKLGRLGA